jgi:ribosomal protein S20
MSEIKKEIRKFISNVMERDYKKASSNLSNIVDRKIERKIINNNISIF